MKSVCLCAVTLLLQLWAVDYGTSLDYSFKFPEAGNADVITHTLDGAGFWAVYTIFGQSEYFPRVLKHYTAFSGRDIEDLIPAMEAAAKLPLTDVEASIGYYSIDRPTAVAAGAAVCQRVIEKVSNPYLWHLIIHACCAVHC